MPQLEQIAAKAVESGGKLKVRSALNPILWLCGIITVPAIIAASYITPTPTWLIVLLFIPVATAMVGFLFLLLFDRDKLQSEDYQIQKRSLELIEQKGDTAPLMIDNSSLNVIPKPESLPKQVEGDSK